MTKTKMDYDTSLIERVREHPELYDNAHADFKNKEAKNRIWRRIAFDLRQDCDNESVRMVKMRWKSLRDAYVKETKYRNAVMKGDAVKPRKYWRYSRAMSFLTPYLGPPCPAKGFRFKKYLHGVADGAEPVENYLVMPDDLREASYDGSSRSPASDWTGISERYLGSPYYRQYDIDSFFRGVADTVKKLTPVNQIKVQRDIVNMILDVKLKEIKENEDSGSS